MLGKPLSEMCWFYLGVAQIALDPPPLCQTGKHGKKVPLTILASPYTPLQTWEKSAPNNPRKPLHALTGNAHIEEQHISKRDFPTKHVRRAGNLSRD